MPAAETIVELERLARELGGGVVGTAGELEVQPGPDQRHPRRRARLARPALGVRAARRAVRPDRRVRARARRGPRSRRRVRQAPGAAGAADGRRRRRGARGERGGERRDVPADALGRRPRHAVRGLAGAERDGLRAVPRRPLAHAARAGRHRPTRRSPPRSSTARSGGWRAERRPAPRPRRHLVVRLRARPGGRAAHGGGRDRAARLRRALVPRGIRHPRVALDGRARPRGDRARPGLHAASRTSGRATPWRRRPRRAR